MNYSLRNLVRCYSFEYTFERFFLIVDRVFSNFCDSLFDFRYCLILVFFDGLCGGESWDARFIEKRLATARKLFVPSPSPTSSLACARVRTIFIFKPCRLACRASNIAVGFVLFCYYVFQIIDPANL